MPSDIDNDQPHVDPPRADDRGDAPVADGPGVVAAESGPAPAPPSTEDGLGTSDTQAAVAGPSPGVSSASSDELTASLNAARPDPLLGAFVTEESPAATDPGPSAPGPRDVVVGQGPNPGSRADAMSALAGLDLRGNVPTTGGLSGSSSDAIAALAIDTPPPARTTTGRPSVVDDDEDDDDEDDLPPARGISLGTMLLASYASAVTLGLIWVLVTGRRLPQSAGPDEPPGAGARVNPGGRGENAPKAPIPAEHMATLGKTVRLGLIEATPLAVTSGPVTLERNFEGHQIKTGGERALKLRLRLRNVSAERAIAPLDEAFLRDRPNSSPDSFIETSAGGPTIAQFPLAVESEWAIVGQQFRELKPGETFEALVVSAPDALAIKAPEMTWRIRLRTDLNHDDDLGVRFQESDIKPGK